MIMLGANTRRTRPTFPSRQRPLIQPPLSLPPADPSVSGAPNAVTLKVLHGSDRGRVYESLAPPFTVGREEGNDIQLNDERISRCHFKVQRDNDRLVLTDLDSTNGTKVNGVECQLRILRHGDLIAVGRSLLLVGSESQIASRLAAMDPEPHSDLAVGDIDPIRGSSLSAAGGENDLPSLPGDLSAGQRAQVAEVMEHLQTRLHNLIDSADASDGGGTITLDFARWQQLLAVQSKLAEAVRQLAEP